MLCVRLKVHFLRERLLTLFNTPDRRVVSVPRFIGILTLYIGNGQYKFECIYIPYIDDDVETVI